MQRGPHGVREVLMYYNEHMKWKVKMGARLGNKAINKLKYFETNCFLKCGEALYIDVRCLKETAYIKVKCPGYN